jgi:TonB-linked SusC/RagA family outer membrane protein
MTLKFNRSIFTVLASLMIIFAGSFEAFAQSRLVSGTVTDNAGQPIMGAGILEKGNTSNGSITDLDGKFQIAVASDAVLMVSSIGYLDKEVAVNGQAVLKIVLDEDIESLDEVVVTALGITRSEKALGYASQKFDGENLEKVKGVNIATSLTGRIAGMRVFNSTEFNQAPTIKLRGEAPLIVVDGVPTDQAFSDFNQDVIENITVLKGATASALYGSRGGNGAIMITTKKGGSKGFTIEVNSSNMFFTGYLKIPEVQTSYSSGQGGKWNNDDYVWGDKLDIGRTAMQWDPILKERREMELKSVGKDNFKNFLEFSVVSNTTVSASSSNEYGSFRTSLSYMYDKNPYPNTYKNKFWYNVGGELKLGKKASIEGSLNFSKENAPNSAGYGYGTGYMYNILLWTGTEYDLTQYKDYWLVPNESQNWHYSDWYDNPYFEAYEKIRALDNFSINGSLNFNYQILPWLKFQARMGGVSNADRTICRSSVGTISKNRGYWYDGKLGYYSEEKETMTKLNYDAFFMVNKKWENLSIDAILGGSIYTYHYNSLQSNTKNGLSVPGFYSIAASVETPEVSTGTSRKQVNSLFGTLTVGYKDTYYLDVTGRNDWTSTLPVNENSYFYPSVGLSFIGSQYAKTSWLPFWKLRGSWTVSKRDLSIYALNQAYSISSAVWDGLSSSSYPSTILGGVKPITDRTWEIGANLHFLEGSRIIVDLAYFNKYTYNNTKSQTISSASGFSSRLMNIGEEYVRRGIELSVDATAIKRSNFTWDINANISKSHRYFAKIDEEFSTDDLWTKVGGRTDYYSYKLLDTDPNGNLIHKANGLPYKRPYAVLCGYTDPDFEWGIANNFRYKRFTLSMTFDGRVGGISWNNTEYRMLDSGVHPSTDNQWRYDQVVNGLKNYVGKGVKVVSGDVKYDSYGRITEDTRVFAENDTAVWYEDYVKGSRQTMDWIQDKTFIKLRELALGYDLPQSFAKKLGMSACSVSLIGQNLFVFSKNFKMVDPDGVDGIEDEDMTSPSVRYTGINLKITF